MKGWKWTLGAGAFVLLLVGLLGCVYKYHEKEIVLEFGMFTGSNWDVASASSFVIMDKAIARFEEEHPGVKIHYYSGISKEDYSEWCARKLVEGKMPDVFMVPDSDFNLYSSLGVLKNLDGSLSMTPGLTGMIFSPLPWMRESTKDTSAPFRMKQFPFFCLSISLFWPKSRLRCRGRTGPGTTCMKSAGG